MICSGWLARRTRRLVPEFVDAVDVCFDRCRNDVGVRAKTIIDGAVVLQLNMHLPDIIAAFADRLHGELAQRHRPVDDALQRLDRRIHRAIAG